MANDNHHLLGGDQASSRGGISTSIPLIDISPFTQPNESTTAPQRRQTAASLVAALRHTGFAYVTNHGVPLSALSDAFALSRAFFALPPDTKMLAAHPPGWQVHRGYSRPGLEKVSNAMATPTGTSHHNRTQSGSDSTAQTTTQVQEEINTVQTLLRQTPDLKESFDIGHPLNRHQPNVFLPPDVARKCLPPNFEPSILLFHSTLWTLARALLRAIALGLPLREAGDRDEDLLARPCQAGRYSQLRLLRYPPAARTLLESGAAERMPAHSDWSVLTVLFQDACGGLQVEVDADADADGEVNDGVGTGVAIGSSRRRRRFVDVEPVEGAAVVNVGDLLMRWSNDYLKSTQHRVTIPPHQASSSSLGGAGGGSSDGHDGGREEQLTPERFSIPYFVTTAPDFLVEPLCVDADHPPRYEPITQGDYAAMRASMQYY